LDVYTTAGANGQISSALGYLPGVQKVGESEGLFVRGGTGAETKIFMDGNLVNNYFTNLVPELLVETVLILPYLKVMFFQVADIRFWAGVVFCFDFGKCGFT
jgi:hypothetical protein